MKRRGCDYDLARLDRADPDDLAIKGMTAGQFADLAARVRADELSANAAAIEAGFRKRQRQIRNMFRICDCCISIVLDAATFGGTLLR